MKGFTRQRALLTGVEGAKSQPSVAYATSISASGDVATLLRSEDTGQTWTPFDVALAQYAQPSIVAIDPTDENTVYMRVTTGLTDSIVVTHDGGMTFQAILTINDNFRAFLRAGDGTLYAGTINGALYVLPPGAQQFEARTGPISVASARGRGRAESTPAGITCWTASASATAMMGPRRFRSS